LLARATAELVNSAAFLSNPLENFTDLLCFLHENLVTYLASAVMLADVAIPIGRAVQYVD
jgi:hypothetical protein